MHKWSPLFIFGLLFSLILLLACNGVDSTDMSVSTDTDAQVLESTELWREVITEVSKDFPEIELSHMYADNAAMQIIRNPKQFDTIVTTNMFGDILSDAAAMMTGSLGMLPSASIGGTNGMYEPVHGSAPDISGQDKANPLATILSVGMMLRYSFDLTEADEMIKKAVGGHKKLVILKNVLRFLS